MTNIVANVSEPVNNANRQAGMKIAGQGLATWLTNHSNNSNAKSKDIFDDLYNSVSALNVNFFLVDDEQNTFKLLPVANGSGGVIANQFEIDGTTDKLIIHGEKDNKSGLNKPMTIAVPEVVGADTIDYLENYVTDVMEIAQSGSADVELQLRNYLLASIFLTRCH